MTRVRIRFLNMDHPDWGEDFPRAVHFPRVPLVGERITGPNDSGTWIVHEAPQYDFYAGFLHDPIVRLVCRKAGEHDA